MISRAASLARTPTARAGVSSPLAKDGRMMARALPMARAARMTSREARTTSREARLVRMTAKAMARMTARAMARTTARALLTARDMERMMVRVRGAKMEIAKVLGRVSPMAKMAKANLTELSLLS